MISALGNQLYSGLTTKTRFDVRQWRLESRSAPKTYFKGLNYLLNEGSATAAQILELVDEVKRRVKRTHGVDLELEVELIGDFE